MTKPIEEVRAEHAVKAAEARVWAEVYTLAVAMLPQAAHVAPAEMIIGRDDVIEAAIKAGRPEIIDPAAMQGGALVALRQALVLRGVLASCDAEPLRDLARLLPAR